MSWIPDNRKVLLCLCCDADHNNDHKIMASVDPENYKIDGVNRGILVKSAKQMYPGITSQAYCMIFESERSPYEWNWGRKQTSAQSKMANTTSPMRVKLVM